MDFVGYPPPLPSLSDTLASLVEETGCPLEHPMAATFRTHVIAGHWDEVIRQPLGTKYKELLFWHYI